MKLSRSLLILSSAAIGLTVATGQDGGPNSTPTKAQQILRQKMAATDGSARPSNEPKPPAKAELLIEIQRLHQEGKITDQQSEAFRKNINDQYTASAGPDSTEAVARVRPVVEAKPAPPKAAEQPQKTVAPAPKPTPEPRAQAQQAPPPRIAPAPKPAATPTPQVIPPQPEKRTVAQKAPEKPVAAQPAATTGTLTPEQEAKAREALRAQIAAGSKQEKIEPVAPAPDANARARALATLRQQEAAAQPAPAPRPAPKAAAAPAPTPKPEPVPDPEAQAKALAALRKLQAAEQPVPSPQPAPAVVAKAPAPVAQPKAALQPITPAPAATLPPPAPASAQQDLEAKAGIRPDTPDLTKVLRVKVAEVEGTVPRQQAEQIIAPLVAAPVLSDSKKQGLERLAELNELYKANRITPAQYHEERAKIVATLNK